MTLHAMTKLARTDTAAPAEGAERGGSHREQAPANAHTAMTRICNEECGYRRFQVCTIMVLGEVIV